MNLVFMFHLLCCVFNQAVGRLPVSQKYFHIAWFLFFKVDMYTRVKRDRPKIKRDMYGVPIHDEDDLNTGESSEETGGRQATLGIVGHCGCVVERWTVGRRDRGSNQPAAVSNLGQLHSPQFACVIRKKHKVPSIWCLCQGK